MYYALERTGKFYYFLFYCFNNSAIPLETLLNSIIWLCSTNYTIGRTVNFFLCYNHCAKHLRELRNSIISHI